jgi:hypothetical protein
MKNKSIQSNSRVQRYGEVFTSDKELNNIPSASKHERSRLESIFLESTCERGKYDSISK